MDRFSLDTIEIHGFRGLKRLRLENLGLINILVGENNSGKTSVLEAITILCHPLEPEEWIWVARRRDFGGLFESRIQSLRWCFAQTGQLADPDVFFEGECGMSCEGCYPLRRLTVKYEDIQGGPEPVPTRLVGDPEVEVAVEDVQGTTEPVPTRLARQRTFFEEDGEDLTPRRGARLTHELEFDPERFPESEQRASCFLDVWEYRWEQAGRPPVKQSLIQCETLTPYSYQINRTQVRLLSRRTLSRHEDQLLELVQVFDPAVEKIEILSLQGLRPSIYLRHKRLGSAPLSVFGDGLRRVMLLANTLLSLREGSLLLLDEIEAGIHVSALQHVYDWLEQVARKRGVQVVATTHSLEALDAMALSISSPPEDLVTYHLEQTESETQVRRIDGELLLRLRRERGLDVR